MPICRRSLKQQSWPAFTRRSFGCRSRTIRSSLAEGPISRVGFASASALGERVLFEAIERMKAANTTVIIITHRIGILAVTNKLAIMEGGAVSAFGDSKEIFERYLTRPQVASQQPAPPPPECEISVGASPETMLP